MRNLSPYFHVEVYKTKGIVLKATLKLQITWWKLQIT